MGKIFLDGTGITPGTQKCKCGAECELPCWQRLGWAEACTVCGCPPFPECEHKHWYKDTSNEGIAYRICEDCGESIRESDVRKAVDEA